MKVRVLVEMILDNQTSLSQSISSVEGWLQSSYYSAPGFTTKKIIKMEEIPELREAKNE